MQAVVVGTSAVVAKVVVEHALGCLRGRASKSRKHDVIQKYIRKGQPNRQNTNLVIPKLFVSKKFIGFDSDNSLNTISSRTWIIRASYIYIYI